MFTKHLSVWVGLCAFTLLAPLAQAVTIDDFDVSGVNLTVNVGTPLLCFRENVAGIIGGQRDGCVQFLGTSIPGNEARLRIDVGNSGVLSHSQDDGVTAITTIIWDGSADAGAPNVVDPTGLGGVSLTFDGSVAIKFEIIAADVNGVLRVKIYTDAGNWSSSTYVFPGNLSMVPVTIPFANFTTGAGTGADFNNVGAIVLEVDGSTRASLDVSVDLLDTQQGIPEPMTGGLIILALGTLAGAMARRQRA